eukprot:TRINITY_DN1468_c2_g1_i1.p1 TRINITY_DN1468_c2_g1~~TRINITY_DN1468_c2_g1_i1.p1  ORF type:complete len:626 (+),score=190.90 TRINITY_DN1468_c2_g1_i1:64-1941(+)
MHSLRHKKFKKGKYQSATLARKAFADAQLRHLQGQILSYFSELLHREISQEFRVALQDGTAFCELVQLVDPALMPRYHKKLEPFFMRENTVLFLRACKRLGFEDTFLFDPSDLLDDKNIKQVTNCLVHFAKVAEKKGLNASIEKEYTFLEEIRKELKEEETSTIPSIDSSGEASLERCETEDSVRKENMEEIVDAPEEKEVQDELEKGEEMEKGIADLKVEEDEEEEEEDKVEEEIRMQRGKVFGTELGSPLLVEPLRLSSDMPRVKKVACGSSHVLVVLEDGQVLSCGLGLGGRLGHGTEDSTARCKAIETLHGIKVVDASCGSNFSVVLTEDGEVYSFGMNEHGQLGLGHTRKSLTPVRIDCYDEDDLAYAIRTEGKEKGQQSEEKRIAKVACGFAHTLLLTTDQHVMSCGWNETGQLGQGDFFDRTVPTLVSCLMGNQWHRILSIQAGYGHTVALTASNIVLGAGGNWAGQLGPSSEFGVNQPFFAPILDLTVDSAQLTHVACGPNSTIASRRSDEGSVIACLRRRRVEYLCTSDESLVLKDGLCVRSISCGVAHAVSFLADGSIVEFRFPAEEEKHDQHHTNSEGDHIILGTNLNVQDKVAAVACGDDFTYIATDDGASES